jgi:hypothetical protein
MPTKMCSFVVVILRSPLLSEPERRMVMSLLMVTALISAFITPSLVYAQQQIISNNNNPIKHIVIIMQENHTFDFSQKPRPPHIIPLSQAQIGAVKTIH